MISGSVLGGFISVSLFLILNDENLCYWLGLVDEEFVVLSHSTFCKIIGVFNFCVGTWILVGIKEKEIDKTKKT